MLFTSLLLLLLLISLGDMARVQTGYLCSQTNKQTNTKKTKQTRLSLFHHYMLCFYVTALGDYFATS